ncbi:Peptide chain release factor N(5)-glutamine methyltransferase [hydrothermal vent metagenome]|uniref:peptide chain release factor N(5)-glutamine methyltransferase n=1 Tax=hydrothermal vent metagenome TaxID=652676 RepID=A0A3B0XCP4_9ZZZZ
MLISQCLSRASHQLAELSDSPRLEAEVLLAYSLQKNRTWLATWPDQTLNEAQLNEFENLLLKRIKGHPVAHITGQREFWSLNLTVNKDTLIPRPDTELMIEQILQLYPQEKNICLADMGTGSGAIALAIASERPNWQIIATDQSAAALQVARQNACALDLQQIEFRQGDWFQPLQGLQFDIIASNPPYIPLNDPHLQQGDVRFEPTAALVSGNDGLNDIRHIAAHAGAHLRPQGRLIIEHGYNQKQEIFDVFIENNYSNITQLLDISKNPRLTIGLKQ